MVFFSRVSHYSHSSLAPRALPPLPRSRLAVAFRVVHHRSLLIYMPIEKVSDKTVNEKMMHEISTSGDDPVVNVPIDDDEDDVKKPAGRQKFPDAFYCPITKMLFSDPVVVPNGDSYEKSAIEARGTASPLYPNRALKSLMEQNLTPQGMIQMASLGLKQKLGTILDQSALPSNDFRPLPDPYYCPLTFRILQDPVIDPEGNTYEKEAIENWIEANGTSPITKNPLHKEVLYPNKAVTWLLGEQKLPRNSDDSSSSSEEEYSVSEDDSEEEILPLVASADMGDEEAARASCTRTTPAIVTIPTSDEELAEERRLRKHGPFTLVGAVVASILPDRILNYCATCADE